MRAKALIHTGFSNERAIVCDTAKDAATIAEFIGQTNQYAIVRVSGNVLKVYTAKSQSRKSMNKKEFQASKEAVLGFVAGLDRRQSGTTEGKRIMPDAVKAAEEIERLRKGIQDYLDGNYLHPRSYRVEGPQTRCPHGINYWDACEDCIDEHFQKLLTQTTT